MGKGLSLGVTVGRIIYFDEIPMQVDDISEKDTVTVSVLGRAYVLSMNHYTEVYPEVFVAVSMPDLKKGYSKVHLLIDAPRSIVILRDNNRNKASGNNLHYQAA